MTIDWLGRYHQWLEGYGEDTEIGCLKVNLATGSYDRIRYTHSLCDGSAALTDGMLKRGYSSADVPQYRARRAPSWPRLLPALARFVKEELVPVRPLPWRFENPRAPFRALGPACYAFTRDETRALGSPLSARVLYALARAVNLVWMKHDSVTRWHIPVNVRDRHDLTNRITNFIQDVRPQDDPRAILGAQFERLRRGAHFATRFFLNRGGMLKAKVDRDYRRPQVSRRVTGTFSSLGAWPRSGATDRHPGEVVIPYGNVSLKNPICLCNIVWHGQLTLSLQAHSSICRDEGEVRLALDHLVRELGRLR